MNGSVSAPSLWLRDPLAILADGAAGRGAVVRGGVVVPRVPVVVVVVVMARVPGRGVRHRGALLRLPPCPPLS